MEELVRNFHRLFAQIQNSCHLDLSQIHQNEEVSDFISKETDSVPAPIRDRLREEFFQNGPLTPLIQDQSVTEIMINGPQNIWYEKNSKLFEMKDQFFSEVTYKNFILRLCQKSKIQTHLNQPFADGKWGDFRVHLIQPPLVKKHFHLCLRRHPESAWTLEQLENKNWCHKKESLFLKDLVEQKQSILIVGATNTGKTSVMNALVKTLTPQERLVIIEDTDELKLPNLLSVKLLTRSDSSGQLKIYDQEHLIKQALRMRPDRIALGEVRGREAKDLLMAFATGHEGGFCTLHAQSARQALYRLEMLVQMGAPQWSVQAIRHLVLLSLDYILVLHNISGQRILQSINKITSLESTGFCLETIKV